MKYLKMPILRRVYTMVSGDNAIPVTGAVRRLATVTGLSSAAVAAFILFKIHNPSLGYFDAAQVKTVIFLSAMLLCCLLDPSADFLSAMFSREPGRHDFKLGIRYGLIAATIILGASFIAVRFFNVTSLSSAIVGNNPAKTNYISMAVYIVVVNTFLEEVFFRGFVFMSLDRVGLKVPAYLFSSALFASYHLYMFTSGFNFLVILLAMAGLFVCGMVLCRLNASARNFYNGWLAHLLASGALMTVGLYLNGYITLPF